MFVERARSPTPEGEPKVYELVLKKRDLLRYHIGKFHTRKDIDLEDRSTFTDPVHLWRRETGPMVQNGDPMDIDSKEGLADQQEKERLEAIRQDRARQREDIAKDVAPTASSKRKAPAFKKKTEQVFRTNDTPEERKRNRLRYEEALPWHIEDFDKQVWVGQYEEALSYRHLLLTQDPENENVMIATPVEKWYRFRQQGKATQMTAEDVEKYMAAKTKEPRFIMRQKEKAALQKQKEDGAKPRMLLRRGDRQETNEDAMEFRETTANADEIDFNLEEEFADDEENPLFEGDDDTTKEAEDRMRKDQLEANTFGVGDEQKVDEEELAKQKAEEAKKAEGAQTSRLLQKREKRMDHEDISGQSDESDSEESDSENANEERKGEDGKTAAAKTKGRDRDGEKIASGASSKGTNTPSGRGKVMPPGSLSHQPSTNTLKRSNPGSGNLSDASGNESARPGKRMKKNDSSAKTTSTPLAGNRYPAATDEGRPNSSRSVSMRAPPAPVRPGPRIPSASGVAPPSSAGPMPPPPPLPAGGATHGRSDGRNRDPLRLQVTRKILESLRGTAGTSRLTVDAADDTASDRGRTQRLKVTVRGSPNGSPNGSRANSPIPAVSQTASNTGSRAASPTGGGQFLSDPLASSTSPQATESLFPIPERDEILQHIPSQGITGTELAKKFSSMAPKDNTVKKQWISRFLVRVREISHFDPNTKLVYPKDGRSV